MQMHVDIPDGSPVRLVFPDGERTRDVVADSATIAAASSSAKKKPDFPTDESEARVPEVS
jgi:hypothetical protein